MIKGINIKHACFNSVAVKPLTLVVHATKNHDPLMIAKDGVNNTITHLPIEINKIELLPTDLIFSESYSVLADEHKIKQEPFLYSKEFLIENKSMFKGNSEYLLTGGAMRRCLTTVFLSILLIKSGNQFNDIANILSGKADLYYGDKDLYKKVVKNHKDIIKLDLFDSNELNFHFNANAIYTDYHDTNIFYDYGDNMTELNLEKDWRDVPELAPNYKKDVHRIIFSRLPRYFEELLDKTKLEIVNYIDGIKTDNLVKNDVLHSFRLNMLYWYSVEGLAKYMHKQV